MDHTWTATIDSAGGSGYAQHVRARHHELCADEPESSGGSDQGPNPYELLLAGLGSCTSITLQMYAQRKGWELGSVRVVLTHRSGEDGDRGSIHRTITIGGDLTDEQRQRLLEVAGKTPVTRTLLAGVDITSELSA